MRKISFALCLSLISTGLIAAGADSAKPAAKVCADFGGTSSVVKSEAGSDVRLCSFGRGIVGEESFFRAKQAKAFAIFLSPPPAPAPTGDPRKTPSGQNPSSRKCQQAGGRTVIVREPVGDFSVCEFSDHSIIEEWTLFRGRLDDLNKLLATALEKRVKSR